MNTFDSITPEKIFLNRRKFLRLAALFGTAYALAACGVKPEELEPTPIPSPTPLPEDILTPEETVNTYNNFYEFTTNKNSVAELAQDFKTSPWPIEIGGLVDNPQTVDAAELIARYPAEERVYRLRCVEGWSMVIPWFGIPLHRLLADLQIKSSARYIAFTTAMVAEQMPGLSSGFFNFPYIEGLRLDEAQNDLSLLAWGAYQKPLLPQTGAPLRLVVPWKYGFKNIKSIVKIELVEEKPLTFWTAYAPQEYSFYANVNPAVNHPRWSQATEYRVGETGQRPTLLFNGYDKEVAALYEGMDLAQDF